jgi:hypothetical protein
MAENGKVKVGIIGSQLAADLHAEGSTFGNSGPEQSQYASSHQFRYVCVQGLQADGKSANAISSGRVQYLQPHAMVGREQLRGTTNFLYATSAHMPRVLQFALRITF